MKRYFLYFSFIFVKLGKTDSKMSMFNTKKQENNNNNNRKSPKTQKTKQKANKQGKNYRTMAGQLDLLIKC